MTAAPETPTALTPDQQLKVLELDALAAVARGEPFKAITSWLCLKLECQGLITPTLTDAGRAQLESGLAKLNPEHRAEFLAKGLNAEFLRAGTRGPRHEGSPAIS